MIKGFLGLDVGSVSTNLVFMEDGGEIKESIYLRTQGRPIAIIQKALKQLHDSLPSGVVIRGVGATGSGRQLAGVIVGADIIKNEITAHGKATSTLVPGTQTILEIGGQDSKILILRNNMVVDFAMNTVCAAGTGSFLDQQAARLGIPIEKFGEIALLAKSPIRIAGRCAVFAESDMIHKQQMGYDLPDILAGLCEALVRNYLNNVGKGKEILPPVAFQGGVAANAGMKSAFEKALGLEIKIPPYYNVIGAVGAALLAEEKARRGLPSCFKGFHSITGLEFSTGGFECDGCPNMCEVVEIREEGRVISRWGDRCGRWSGSLTERKTG